MNTARLIVGLATLASLAGCTVLSPDATTENNGTVAAPGSSKATPTAGSDLFAPPGSTTDENGQPLDPVTGEPVAAPPPPEPTATDAIANGNETDVDCGGDAAPACAADKRCRAAADCTSLVCTDGTCKAPTFTDGVKNGNESDVDCGGADATPDHKCGLAKVCAAHADCTSDGCGDDHKCADFRSCTGLHGGRTCGAGEFGEAGTTHESCCAEASVPSRGVQLDKYMITAGRMRAFLDRVGGNVRGAMEGNPKWVADYSQYMPTNMTEALAQLGPYAQDFEWPREGIAGLPRSLWAARGCNIAGFGARTYWQPAIDGGETNAYSQESLDEKALNCVTTAMSLALCLWDGKDLADPADLTAAWVGNDNRKYPWGNNPAPPSTDGADSPYLVHVFNYQYPTFTNGDASAFIAAPGRRPMGNGPYGHADLAGNMLEQARRGSTTYYLASGSWERHEVGTYGLTYTENDGTNGDTVWNRRYYAIGARCARR